ncbi:phage portal protein [Secundilactobacillus kimchicus]|uniref:phage portal protein n=1 Tax=Secundilactobacillus kimchicus TaxID=528209 RepID=UPI0024A7D4B0|nr:phage portal protein [Secundilactobacillus kimchicus]
MISGHRPVNQDTFNDDENLGKRIVLNDSDVFLYSAEAKILDHLDDVMTMIVYHRDNLAKAYRVKRDYYKGRHRRIINATDKKLGKPDNRIIINYPKKLINTFNGFFSGDPVQVSYQENGEPNDAINEKIQDFLKNNDYDDVFSEASKYADIYGRSYLYCYTDKDSKLHMAACDPINMFMVYDDTIEQQPIAGVRYAYRGSQLTGTIITANGDYKFTDDGKGEALTLTNTDEDGVTQNAHPFPRVPTIEFEENDERLGLLDDIANLIDSVDQTMSEKMNDVDYFGDAYLAIIGVKLTDKQKQEVAETKLFNLYQEDDNDSTTIPQVEFLNKISNDDTQEHYLDRAIDMLYQISQVVNLSDSQFGMSADSASGVALINKYQAMQAMAKTKSRKMSKMLRALFAILFDVENIANADVTNLSFSFQQSVPHNDSEEATTYGTLFGKVPDELALSYLSKVDDPKKVAEKMKEDGDDGDQQTANMVERPDKVGETDDKSANRADANKATVTSG